VAEVVTAFRAQLVEKLGPAGFKESASLAEIERQIDDEICRDDPDDDEDKAREQAAQYATGRTAYRKADRHRKRRLTGR
jgi:hypothetical protein